MKKRIAISFVLIACITNFVIVTPKNYLRYVFYNIEIKNYKVVNYLKSKEKELLKEMYLYAEDHEYSKPKFHYLKISV